MPSLRFSRDKRGYENTFVVHTSRRRARAKPRILYWFRTPPGIRVGRAALDEQAIRLIEEHHPDIEFDWPQILKGQEEAPPRSERPDRPERPARPSTDRERTRPQPALPAAPPPAAEPAPEPINPAHARVGSEGLARLRARYADMLARIARRVPDEQRRSALAVEVERLNPDAWVTDGEVQRGLDQYEAAFESLASAVGRRRRWRRARGGRPAEGEAGTASAADAAGGSTPEGEGRPARPDGNWEPDDEAGAGAAGEDGAAEEEEEDDAG